MNDFKPENAKGVADFYGEDAILRNRIKNSLRTIFELYGYLPLETPILEKADLLIFKGGDEICREVFQLTDQGSRKLGLRFDQTVPMTRYVAMHPELKFPFKRYEIGYVFRDGPAQVERGRFRVFTQCDVDIVGVKEMTAEAEILALTKEVFKELKLGDVAICVNNRKILEGFMEYSRVPEQLRHRVIATVDKRDKIGIEGVTAELEAISDNGKLFDTKALVCAIQKQKTNQETLQNSKEFLFQSKIGLEGLTEIQQVLDYSGALNVQSLDFEPSLARGLSYYTGTTFEVFLKDKNVFASAITAGGRYDKMIGSYLPEEKEYPAVGISFGLERIVQVIKGQKSETKEPLIKIYIIPIGNTLLNAFELASELRSKGVNVDMDLTGRKIKQNIKYAEAMGIRHVCFLGSDEVEKGELKVKNIIDGREETFRRDSLDQLKGVLQ